MEAAVAARTRCGWVMFRECCELKISSKAEMGCLYELRKARNTPWK